MHGTSPVYLPTFEIDFYDKCIGEYPMDPYGHWYNMYRPMGKNGIVNQGCGFGRQTLVEFAIFRVWLSRICS